jgi:hypothetical protein
MARTTRKRKAKSARATSAGAKSATAKSAKATSAQRDPFRLRRPAEAAAKTNPLVHIIRKGVKCDTEKRGFTRPRGRSPTRIVVDASEGFIPLWARGTTLRWRIRESSLESFEDPDAAQDAIEELLGESILKWGDAAPVRFSKRDDAWDFEIVMRKGDDCDINGCTLASAFFPDAGRHKLLLYPKLFEQSRREQVDTIVHEIGHVFGLRHFFALVEEKEWPARTFGKHHKFSIMNYGKDSKLTSADKSDLKKLYQLAWAGSLTHINKTPIRFVKPFHTTGDMAESVVAVGQIQTVVEAPRRRAPRRRR